METQRPSAAQGAFRPHPIEESPFEQLLDFVKDRFHAQHPNWEMLPFSLRKVGQTSGLANGLWTLELRAKRRYLPGPPRIETFSAVHVPFGENPVLFSMKKPEMNSASRGQ